MLDGSLTWLAGGGAQIAFDRRIEKPIAKIWAALTEPERVAKWLGDVEVDLRVGGKYVIHFRDMKVVMTGVISALEPPHVLEHSWLENYGMPQSLLRWQLAEEGAACRLTLRQIFPPVAWKDVVSFLGGWHAFLEALPRAADGEFVPYATQEERDLDTQYRAKFPNWE